MAHAAQTAIAAPARRGSDGLLAGLAARLDRYRLFRRTLSELSQLTDRELADIGIHRTLIREIAQDVAGQVRPR